MKVARKQYQICYPDPISLKQGDLVKVINSEPEESEWFGWHFCSDQNENEGWISNDFIDIQNHSGRVLKDYSAKELNAEIGQLFRIISESYGWYWCENEQDEKGWLPTNLFDQITLKHQQ